MGVTIGDFLNLTYPYDYTGLVIYSPDGKYGKAIYRAYADDLDTIIKHLKENFKNLLQYPLNFFLINVHKEYDVTLLLYMTENYSGKKVKTKCFDLRKKGE